MTSLEFINQKLQGFNRKRLTGVRILNEPGPSLGLCDTVTLPGKFLLTVYAPPDIPYFDEATGLHLESRDEYDVLVAGHEVYHWLSQTRQVRGADTERRADAFGAEWLWEFRAIKQCRAKLPMTLTQWVQEYRAVWHEKLLAFF